MSTIVTTRLISCLGTTCVPCEGCAMGTCVPRVRDVMGPYESLATRPPVSPRHQLMVEGTSGDTCNCHAINSRSNPRRRAICWICQRYNRYFVVLCNVIVVGVRLCQAAAVVGRQVSRDCDGLAPPCSGPCSGPTQQESP